MEQTKVSINPLNKIFKTRGMRAGAMAVVGLVLVAVLLAAMPMLSGDYEHVAAQVAPQTVISTVTIQSDNNVITITQNVTNVQAIEYGMDGMGLQTVSPLWTQVEPGVWQATLADEIGGWASSFKLQNVVPDIVDLDTQYWQYAGDGWFQRRTFWYVAVNEAGNLLSFVTVNLTDTDRLEVEKADGSLHTLDLIWLYSPEHRTYGSSYDLLNLELVNAIKLEGRSPDVISITTAPIADTWRRLDQMDGWVERLKAPPMPTLWQPADGMLTSTAQLTLTWVVIREVFPAAVIDDPVEWYELVVGPLGGPQQLISTAASNYPAVFADGQYTWAVASCNPRGCSEPSAQWQFTVITELPASVLLTPADGEQILNSSQVDFEWQPVNPFDLGLTITYTLMVSTGSEPVLTTQLETTNNTAMFNLPNGQYQWSVRAETGPELGLSSQSEVWGFTVESTATQVHVAGSYEWVTLTMTYGQGDEVLEVGGGANYAPTWTADGDLWVTGFDPRTLIGRLPVDFKVNGAGAVTIAPPEGLQSFAVVGDGTWVRVLQNIYLPVILRTYPTGGGGSVDGG